MLAVSYEHGTVALGWSKAVYPTWIFLPICVVDPFRSCNLGLGARLPHHADLRVAPAIGASRGLRGPGMAVPGPTGPAELFALR